MSIANILDPSELNPGTVLIGIQADYRIESKLGEGMRGTTYIASAQNLRTELPDLVFDRVADNQQVVIKTVNLSLDWPLVQVLKYLSGVNFSLQKELLVLANLRGLDCAAQVYDYHHFTSLLGTFPVHPMFIVQEYIPGQTLGAYVKNKWGASFAGIGDSRLWFQFASLIATSLVAIHQREVVHRDIWPPNIMVQDGDERSTDSIKLKFIDFGDAVLRHELAARDDAVGHEHPYKAPERLTDWLWPTRRGDIYAVGGVFYFLATGKHPHPAVRDNEALKRIVLSDIRASNSTLLVQNQGAADIIARCLRYDPTDRIRDADELVHEIDVFRDVDRPRSDWAPAIKAAKDKIVAQTVHFEQLPQDVMSAMALQDLQFLAQRLESMTHGVRDITGDHNEIVDGLTSYLSLLREGDEYLAVTVPKFWKAENLGINGRFLTMNKLIADRGVSIRRLFLVTDEEWRAVTRAPLTTDNQEYMEKVGFFREVVKAHQDIQAGLKDGRTMDLRYLIMPKDVRTEYLKTDLHRGAWISGKSAVTIVPVYSRRGRIRTVRMRRYQGQVKSLKADMLRLIERGKVLDLPIT